MKRAVYGILICIAIGVLLVQAASAVPPLPCEYYGQVIIDGAPAPAGTVITATISGVPRGSVATTTAGALGGLSVFDPRLVVSATEGDIDANYHPTVNFTVNGVCTNGFTASVFYSGETRVITLASRGLLTVPGMTLKPTDPDGDGIYEDLNANGRLDFADVVLYFNQMTWIAANEPVCAFDLNGNSRIDFADIVALFNEI